MQPYSQQKMQTLFNPFLHFVNKPGLRTEQGLRIEQIDHSQIDRFLLRSGVTVRLTNARSIKTWTLEATNLCSSPGPITLSAWLWQTHLLANIQLLLTPSPLPASEKSKYSFPQHPLQLVVVMWHNSGQWDLREYKPGASGKIFIFHD